MRTCQHGERRPGGLDASGEVVGSCRWLAAVGAARPGSLLINGAEYAVVPIRVADVLVGYQVGEYEVALNAGRLRCSCRDFQFRRRRTEKGCKHTAALRAALPRCGRRLVEEIVPILPAAT